MAAKKATKRATARKRAPRKAKAESTGLEARESLYGEIPAELRPIVDRIVHEGGALVGAYRDPFGGHPLAVAVLPIARVEPTPFQRDLSETHHKRLADVVTKTERFLDPVVVVTAPKEGFWTPNGRHRLEA